VGYGCLQLYHGGFGSAWLVLCAAGSSGQAAAAAAAEPYEAPLFVCVAGHGSRNGKGSCCTQQQLAQTEEACSCRLSAAMSLAKPTSKPLAASSWPAAAADTALTELVTWLSSSAPCSTQHSVYPVLQSVAAGVAGVCAHCSSSMAHLHAVALIK